MEINNSLRPNEPVLSETDEPATEQTLRLSKLSAELDELNERNQRIKDDREMRKEYAGKAYSFAKCTLISWGILVFLYILVPDKEKLMSVEIFGIITTACTVNILVAFHAVIKGLFSTPKE